MDLGLKTTIGLATGAIVQFAEGTWSSAGHTLGAGVAMTEEAFGRIEPLLGRAWTDWDPGFRYGVAEVPATARTALVRVLIDAAERERCEGAERQLLRAFAAWIAERLDSDQPITLLGL